MGPNGFGKISIATTFLGIKTNKLIISKEDTYKNDEERRQSIEITDEKGTYLINSTGNQLNNLSTNNLSIGQKLLIMNPEDYFEYIVKSGDTLYSIAKKYNISINEIQKLNNLENTSLSIGQILYNLNN